MCVAFIPSDKDRLQQPSVECQRFGRELGRREEAIDEPSSVFSYIFVKYSRDRDLYIERSERKDCIALSRKLTFTKSNREQLSFSSQIICMWE